MGSSILMPNNGRAPKTRNDTCHKILILIHIYLGIRLAIRHSFALLKIYFHTLNISIFLYQLVDTMYAYSVCICICVGISMFV